ncbi:hypothetical protein [Butyrivibrio sp. YAB3001]|uniref:hypothetical protein n=1 Tax=Butyrivibrio sp. YAB3001 TaxID=1520812 RepID=UPI0008F65D4D|nr:hypothetical protein [Butyrivibrio sp. YAB3001]SFB96577.1 hypothetical protein SAMN02910398_01162 [Butyrivibrio sp. YAB3001]
MLQLSYLGIAFAVVFYFVFGIAVRLMELSDKQRNKARLRIILISFATTSASSLFAGLINLNSKKIILGVLLVLLSFVTFVFLAGILIELHQIKTKIKIRRFMVLFDKVSCFINEGKTQEEILAYLVEIQKLTVKEAKDFLEFISDPTNYQFLSDVNQKIHESQIFKN